MDSVYRLKELATLVTRAWKELDDRLREKVVAYIDEYREMRPELEVITEQLRVQIKQIFNDTDVRPLFVAARTKSVESFRQKASRTVYSGEEGQERELEFPDPISMMHDIVGIRVIVQLPRQVKAAAQIIKRCRNEFYIESDREKETGSVETGTYGYSSRHLIVRPKDNQTVADYEARHPQRVLPFVFEIQIRTILTHAWSEFEHEIRFKRRNSEAWTPYLDREFTGAAAMLDSVEHLFTDIDQRHQRILAFWDANGVGGEELTSELIGEVWSTMWPHLEYKEDSDWEWARELLASHNITTPKGLASLLDATTITHVRQALDHRFSPGPDRLLDDLLLWKFGYTHLDLTAQDDPRRRASLSRRLQQIRTYRRQGMQAE